MTELLNTFLRFMEHPEAEEMFITGGAGTGKTTILATLLEHCIEVGMGHNVCAYTHKAVKVLAENMPKKTNMSTLHKFLTKVPTTNTLATKLQFVEGNAVSGEAELVQVLFVDEFSMIGEQDAMDIKALQYDDKENLVMKVVFIGDKNQLPPVKDAMGVIPNGDFIVKLTKVYRQANDNKLLDTLIALQGFIEGSPVYALKPHETFERGVDIVQEYMNCKEDKVLLAYTNERVEGLNAMVQGYSKPKPMDDVFSPTTRRLGKFMHEIVDPGIIVPVFGERIDRRTKFNPLNTLLSLDLEFMMVEEVWDDKTVQVPRAVVFGHKNYKDKAGELVSKAVKINQKILKPLPEGLKIADWMRQNPTDDLTFEYKRAWREHLTFKRAVICLDFNHAMTVHKSQGSTYHSVFIDSQDLGLAKHWNYIDYLKLMYVAISRASHQVKTS